MAGFRFRRPVRALRPTVPMVVASYTVLIIASLVAIVPFLYVLSTSVKETRSLFSYPPEWIPQVMYWGNYQKLLTETPFVLWAINTLAVALAVTVIKLLIDAMAAYALAKLDFSGKGLLSGMLLLSVAIPVAALIIPLFFLVRNMGLLNSYWALVLPPLANPLGIFMIRSFIVSLPDDLLHSARMDGESEFGIFYKIILPLIRPGLIVHAIFTFMLQYTNFLWPLVAIQDERKQVLTVGISSLQSNFVIDWGLISAAALLSAVPITLLFIFLQRFFLAQNLAGAFKG